MMATQADIQRAISAPSYGSTAYAAPQPQKSFFGKVVDTVKSIPQGLANFKNFAEKDFYSPSSGVKPEATNFAQHLFQDTVGSHGAMGLLQAPGRNAADAVLGGIVSKYANPQIQVGDGQTTTSSRELENVTTALLNKAQSLPQEDPRRAELLRQAQENTRILGQSSDNTKEALSKANFAPGQDSTMDRFGSLGGQALNTAATFAPGLAGGGVVKTALGIGGLSAAGSVGSDLAGGERDFSKIATDAAQAGLLGTGLGLAGGVAGRALSRVAQGTESMLGRAAERTYRSTFPTTEREAYGAMKALSKGTEKPMTGARWALDKGLSGNPVQQASKANKIATDAMSNLDTVAKASQVTTGVPDPIRTMRALETIVGGFDSQLNDAAVAEGRRLMDVLGTSEQLRAEDLLALRRYIDKARTNTSFKLDPQLSNKQDAYKSIADELRGLLRKNYPEMTPYLDDYHYGVSAIDDALSKAVKEGNQRIVGSFDQLFGGVGFLSSPVAGAATTAATIGMRAAGLTRPATFFGRQLDRGAKAIGGARSVFGRVPRIPGFPQAVGRGSAMLTDN